MPPPMHIVVTTRRAPMRRPARSACPTSRCPVIPYGWPMAIAPPSMLSRSSGMPSLSRQYMTCTAKASFNSQRSMSPHLESRPGEELRHRMDRADAHLVGLAAGDRETTEDTERLDAATARLARADQHAGPCAIGELARVAGRDHPARRRRSDFRQGLVGRAGPQALVDRDRHLSRIERVGRWIDPGHPHADRRDLVLEMSGLLRSVGALLAQGTVPILWLPRDGVSSRHHSRPCAASASRAWVCALLSTDPGACAC